MQQRENSGTGGCLKRRGFIVQAIYAATSLIAGTLAASVGKYLLGTPHQEENPWADAGDISNIQTGNPQEVTFDRIRVDGWSARNEKASAWVILDNKKTLTAFSPLCTHLGCAYTWQAQRKAFLCPCHGSVFSADGKVLAGPAGRSLDRYTVKVEGTRLWLGPIESSQTS
jgi:menaquinol-cytochrome c reductase iron-sulfur subunit